MKLALWPDGFRTASLAPEQRRGKGRNRKAPAPTRRRIVTFEVLEVRWLLSTVEGIQGDGNTSVEYDPVTGAFAIQPDGDPVGLFDIRSDSGIFTPNAIFPSGGFVVVNEANR